MTLYTLLTLGFIYMPVNKHESTEWHSFLFLHCPDQKQVGLTQRLWLLSFETKKMHSSLTLCTTRATTNANTYLVIQFNAMFCNNARTLRFVAGQSKSQKRHAVQQHFDYT